MNVLGTLKTLAIINTVAQTTLTAVSIYDHLPLMRRAPNAVVGAAANVAVAGAKLAGKAVVETGKATWKAGKYVYKKTKKVVADKYDNWKYGPDLWD